MNKTPDKQHPDDDCNIPPIEKTIVEGSTQKHSPGDLSAGALNKATQLDTTNPSNGKTGNTLSDTALSTDMLPDGKEPIPLGSGTVVGVLGSGGMAKVYKIWNEKLEIFRAVKILIPGKPSLKKRFDTEAKLTAKLHHPNIVEIYNVGEWNNLPFLEMEFIDGESLDSFIRKSGKLPDTICSAIAIYIARALAFAHSQDFLLYGKNYHGIIHRDLKPANIMISTRGDVRLMDFGIARPTEASLHTQEGNIVGTMQYLSPEQFDGFDVDTRTDIYSFGAILYEMLTGTKAFPQDTITNLMKRKILNDYRRFTDFDFSVAPGLAKITQKCLQLHKEDRYDNVEMLLKDLEQFHRSATSEAPGKALKAYVTDPESFVNSSKGALKSPFKLIIPIAAGAIIVTLATVLLLTDPKSNSLQQSTSNIETSTNTNLNQNTSSTGNSGNLYDTSTNHNSEIFSNTDFSNNTKSESSGIQIKTDTANSSITKGPKVSNFTRPGTPAKAILDNSIKKGIATSSSTTKKDSQPPSPPPLSDIDKLKQKYSEENLFLAGKTALKSREFADAVIAFENASVHESEATVKDLLLFEAYLESGRTGDAQNISKKQSIADAQYYYLCGRLSEKTGKVKEALNFYQMALTVPSFIRPKNEILNDALYHTAILWSAQHKANPSPDSRIRTLNAWNIVKRSYSNNPEHPRFKRANSELSSTN